MITCKYCKLYLKTVLFIILFTIIVIIIPTYLLKQPLNGDELTFLSIGNFIKNGSILYKDIIDIKPPGIFLTSGIIISLFGKSFIAARIVIILIHLISSIFVYKIGVKLKNKNLGMIACLLFLLGINIPKFQGLYFLTEPFATLFLIISFWYFIKKEIKFKLLSGFFLGISVLYKPTALLFLIAIILYYLLQIRLKENRCKNYIILSLKKLFILTFGILIPFVICYLYFFMMGAENQFLYYSFLFITGYSLPYNILSVLIGFFSFFPFLIITLSIILTHASEFIKEGIVDKKIILLSIWFILSLIPIFIINFDHRTLLVIPASALLSAFFLDEFFINFKKIDTRIKLFIVFSLIISIVFVAGANAYYVSYQNKDFMSYENIEYLADEVSERVNGSIYLFPDENGVYFFSDLEPAVPYIGGIYSNKIACYIVNKLNSSNVDFVVAKTTVMEKFENNSKNIFLYNSKKIIYDFIVDNFIEVDKTKSFRIYSPR